MSVDLLAHFAMENTLSEQQLIIALGSESPNLRRALMEWHPHHSAETAASWAPVEVGSGGKCCVFVPNWVLTVYPRRAELFQGTRWGTLWTSVRYQHLLRLACFDLAKLFGSQAALYAPETLHVEGETFEEVLHYLRASAGEPAKTIDDMRRADHDSLWTGKGAYYVDDFKDLPQPAEAVLSTPPVPPDVTEVDWPYRNWPPELNG